VAYETYIYVGLGTVFLAGIFGFSKFLKIHFVLFSNLYVLIMKVICAIGELYFILDTF